MTAVSLTASQVWHTYGHDPKARFVRADELRRLRAELWTLSRAIEQYKETVHEQDAELVYLREKLYGPKGEV